MTGPLIYGFSEDAVAAAKVMADFAKANDKLVIKGGAYAGKALDADGVKALASRSPASEVLIAQLWQACCKSPIQRTALACWRPWPREGAALREAGSRA
jgi:large subunit ribosomal protein L10